MAADKYTQQHYAIKMIPMLINNNSEVTREESILATINNNNNSNTSKNIIGYYGSFADDLYKCKYNIVYIV